MSSIVVIVAEGKEHLGGFLIIRAPDLDSALDWGPRARASAWQAERHDMIPGPPRPASPHRDRDELLA